MTDSSTGPEQTGPEQTGPGAASAEQQQRERLAARIRRIGVLRRFIVASALLWVVAQAVVTMATIAYGESWVAAYRADPYSDPVLGGFEIWALGQLAVMVVAWLVTSAWLWQIRTNAELVEPDSQGLARSSVVTGWIVPVFMLWTPYEALTDAAVPTVRVTRGRDAASDLPVLVRLWWASYLLTLFVTILPHGYPLGTEQHLPALRNLNLLAVGVAALSAVLWLRLVGRVTEVQADVQVLAEAAETVKQAADARPGRTDVPRSG